MDQQWWQPQPPMGVEHPHEGDIMAAAKTRLQGLDQQHYSSGTSADVYQFSHDPSSHWSRGHIFRANYTDDLSFEAMFQAPDDIHQTQAAFRIEEANMQSNVEDMMARTLRLNHLGIIKPSIGGYNSQLERVVWGFTVPTGVSIVTLQDWLQAQIPNAATSIPPEVQELIRTAYLAIMTIWEGESTSDYFANPTKYHMVDNKIKFDPLCIRGRNEGENDEMVPREAFGVMIADHIKPVWHDDELDDLVDLLNYPKAGKFDVLGAPVLLPPPSRELMYHSYDNACITKRQLNWLQENANPQVGWKEKASNADISLKKIINLQAHHDIYNVGFSTGFEGASRFARVVTAHYPQHFRKTAEGKSGVSMKDRVDSLLKQVLPRHLSKRYNSEYIPNPVEEADEADDEVDDE